MTFDETVQAVAAQLEPETFSPMTSTYDFARINKMKVERQQVVLRLVHSIGVTFVEAYLNDRGTDKTTGEEWLFQHERSRQHKA